MSDEQLKQAAERIEQRWAQRPVGVAVTQADLDPLWLARAYLAGAASRPADDPEMERKINEVAEEILSAITVPAFEDCFDSHPIVPRNAWLSAKALACFWKAGRRPADDEAARLRAVCQAVVELRRKETQMRRDYPAGTANAEDAWKEFHGEYERAWSNLEAALEDKP